MFHLLPFPYFLILPNISFSLFCFQYLVLWVGNPGSQVSSLSSRFLFYCFFYFLLLFFRISLKGSSVLSPYNTFAKTWKFVHICGIGGGEEFVCGVRPLGSAQQAASGARPVARCCQTGGGDRSNPPQAHLPLVRVINTLLSYTCTLHVIYWYDFYSER